MWPYDFVEDHTHDGREFRMLNVINEFTRECLAIWVERRLRSTDVVDVLSELSGQIGAPARRSDSLAARMPCEVLSVSQQSGGTGTLL